MLPQVIVPYMDITTYSASVFIVQHGFHYETCWVHEQSYSSCACLWLFAWNYWVRSVCTSKECAARLHCGKAVGPIYIATRLCARAQLPVFLGIGITFSSSFQLIVTSKISVTFEVELLKRLGHLFSSFLNRRRSWCDLQRLFIR